MTKFRALLLLNLKAMLASFHVGGRSKRRAFSGVGVLILIGGLALYLSCVYSFLFASQLAPMGMQYLVIMMMPVLVVVMGLFFTLFAAQGIIFGGKDNDLMLTLPISPFALLLTRVLALYLENLVIALFVMLPAGASYLYYGGPGGVGFGLVLTLCVTFLALLPTLLALVCGFVLSWISSKFVQKNGISSLLYLVLLAAALAGAFRVNLLMADMAGAAVGIQSVLSNWALPFLLLKEASCDGNLLSLLLFCALCLLPFLAVVWAFAGQYKKIVTGLTSHGARSDFRLGRISALGQRRALLKKEAVRFFGTPIYLFNTGVGLIFLVGAGIAALLFRERLTGLLVQLGPMLEALPMPLLLALGVCFMLSTVAVTASSISLEGKQLWILKEAPVAPATLFGVKVGFQLLLSLPCMAVAVTCLTVALSLSPLEWVLCLLSCASFGVANAFFGLYVNLCFPKLDAPNDTVVVKQSAAAMMGIFLPMLMVGLGALVYIGLYEAVGANGVLLICTGLFLICGAVFARLLKTKGTRLFAEL